MSEVLYLYYVGVSENFVDYFPKMSIHLYYQLQQDSFSAFLQWSFKVLGIKKKKMSPA